MHVNPRTGGLGTDLGRLLLNHKQLEGFLQAPVWLTGNPPCLTPAPRRVCHRQLVSGPGNILLFSKAGRLGTLEIPLICTELRFSSQRLEN